MCVPSHLERANCSQVTGFTDLAPVVREQTLKSVLVLITKLSDRTINGELLKHLAKTANDEQPGIRTNTTICLGKMAKYLGSGSRSKVLIAAFSRSLRDPFVHARNAALMALSATSEYFTEEDCATRLLPVICPLLIDKEKLVRDQASKAMDSYVQKVRKAASSMPETALPPPQASDAPAARMGTPQQSQPGWTGWAISSFTNKLSTAAGEMETANGSTPAPAPAPDAKRTTGTASPLLRNLASPPPATSGTASPTPSAVADAFWPEDDGDDGGDMWGDMDENDDGFGPIEDTTSKKPATAVSATPFDDSEPDFAGWLAAQQKKPAKVLPKGLGKPSTASTTTVPAAKPAAKPIAKPATKPIAKPVAKVAPKPIAAKKIDLTPKATDDDDEEWGEGW